MAAKHKHPHNVKKKYAKLNLAATGVQQEDKWCVADRGVGWVCLSADP